MPIYLPAPAPPSRGPDGKGWNRLRIEAGFALGDQCALKPTSYTRLIESQDTRRSRWGGYGYCARKGQCSGCPVLAEKFTLNWLGDEILVRVDPYRPGQLHLMNHPDRGWNSSSLWTTWAKLGRVEDWRFGYRFRDEHGEAFWMHRVPDSADRPVA